MHSNEPEKPGTERLMKPDDVAEHLGIPVTTLRQWKYRGVGPKALKVGRHLRYRRTDLDAWVAGLGEVD